MRLYAATLKVRLAKTGTRGAWLLLDDGGGQPVCIEGTQQELRELSSRIENAIGGARYPGHRVNPYRLTTKAILATGPPWDAA